MEMSRTCAAPPSLVFRSLLCKVVKEKKRERERERKREREQNELQESLAHTTLSVARDAPRQSGLADPVLVLLGALMS